MIMIFLSSMKRNFKVSKNFFQYHYRPFTVCSIFYKSYYTKVPSEPSSLKKHLVQQQRHSPYSVNREAGEEVKLREAATSVASGSSTLGKILPKVSLGQQKQSGKEMTIELTEQELKICDLLRKVTAYLKETKQIPPVELRIAGGWVRDKLLQRECHDLDVAIDSLTGSDFANYIKEFLEKEGDNDQVKIHLIGSNPEKSKHLETATTNLFGLDIDFVNLRKEIYEADSRIPTSLEYGTPKEDAYRRDMTINALFYNIHTGQVEDFTEKGISDLSKGLIRTPLPAYKTFKDDPLRVLRCIRFASRFHFKIVDDVKNAIIKDGSIKVALSEKISRERVGNEVDKMIKGHDPVQAINLIINLGFYDAVFSPPPKEIIVSGNLKDPKICLIMAKILSWLLSDESKDYIHTIFHRLNESEKRALYLATCALPYKDMVYTEKGKSQPAYQYVIRESIKFSSGDVDKVKKLLSSIDFVMNAVEQNNEILIGRSKLGLWIRELESEWPTILLFALSNELIQKFEDMDQVKENKEIKEINNKYTKFIERIYELKLENAYSEKPLLNGKDIRNLLSIKPGKIFREILDSVMEWQLGHPNSSKEECQEFIKHKYRST